MVQNSCCGSEEVQAGPSCCPPEDALQNSSCCSAGNVMEIEAIMGGESSGEVCCGGPPPPRSNPYERAGYSLCHYVRAFLQEDGKEIPLVKTELSLTDHLGTLLARLGLNRNRYNVSPGLYGVGKPGKDSPVIVTANYKLTFDAVRNELTELDVWILVLDTCGINVWCAAGKGTFSTDEIVERIHKTGLQEKIDHRQLIVPQLGASGVAAHQVKKMTGFKVVYGPLRASDLKKFLSQNGCDQLMRLVTFNLKERFELVPVEFYLFGRKIWWVFPALFLLSGIGPWIYSLNMAWERGLIAALTVILGGISGAMVVPLLLPWIPGRAFSLKGLLSGFFFSGVLLLILGGSIGGYEKLALLFSLSSISSYLAMNFTGSTPYTSPSGVEKEMKVGIPLQLAFLGCGLLSWIAAPFLQ